MARLFVLAFALCACAAHSRVTVAAHVGSAIAVPETAGSPPCADPTAAATFDVIGAVATMVGVPSKLVTAASALYQLHEAAQCAEMVAHVEAPPEPPPVIPAAPAPTTTPSPPRARRSFPNLLP